MAASTELRWFGQGELDQNTLELLPAADEHVAIEFRMDDYFAHSNGFGLKVRGGEKIELKQQVGQGSEYATPDSTCSGYIQEWHKWALPFQGNVPQQVRDDRQWTTVVKTRRVRRHKLEGGTFKATNERLPDGVTGCGLEVVNLLVGPDGHSAWSVELEAFGDDHQERRELLILIANQWLPQTQPALALTREQSVSYPEWLNSG